MAAQRHTQVTQLLGAVGRGDQRARSELWEVVHAELRSIAQRQLAIESPGRTLQPTALVNEAYLRLCGGEQIEWTSRRHFFAIAARIMRQIRVDGARRRNRQKRGGAARLRDQENQGSRDQGIEGSRDQDPGEPRTSRCRESGGWKPASIAVEDIAAFDGDPAETLALDEALTRLEQMDPLKAELVMLRFHAGLTREQIGEMLGIAPRTVDKEWAFARAWLRRELTAE